MTAEERQPAPETPNDTPKQALAAFTAATWETWSPDDCPVPSNDEWARQTGSMPPSLRIAWLILTKPKEEVLEIARSASGDETTLELLEDWDRLIELLGAFVEMTAIARARLGIAWGAAIATDAAASPEAR